MNHKKQKQFKKGKVGDRFRTVELNNDNLHQKNRKEITKIVILAAFLLISVIGTSYAFFHFSVDSEKETEIVAGTFKVEFSEGKEIHMSNLAPMSDSEGMTTDSYHFTIKNTGDINAKYNLSLEEMGVNEKTLDKKYIRYSMKLGDSNWSDARYLSDGLLLDSGSLSAESGNDKIEYELKMWLTEDADNSVQGKTFAARIVVSAVQDNTKEQDIIDSTTPVIVLNGESSVTIEQGNAYIDAGVSKIVDDKDRIPTSSIDMTYYYFNNDALEEIDRIDTTRLGTYYIYYKVTDSNGNTGVTVRNVNVVKHNTVSPTITLNGDSIVKVLQGDPYEELGAKAMDSNNRDITSQIKIVGVPNTNVLGTYVVNYIINDSDGNTASVSRTIIVEKKGRIMIDTTEPVLNDGNVTFDVTVESEDGEIDGYLFTKNNRRPTTKEFKKIKNTKKYTTTEEVTKNGTYYIWAKDTNKNVISKEVEISIIDDKGPVCRFSDDQYFGLNMTRSIRLICSDDSRLQTTYLTEKDFIVSNKEIASIINVSGIQKVDDGNQYIIDIKGKKLGGFSLTLKRGAVIDVFGNVNPKESADHLAVTDIQLNKTEINLNISGKNTHQIEVTGAVGALSYVSDHEEIATVDENGLVQAVAPGVATITVTDTRSGALKTLKVHIDETLSVSFIKSGRGVSNILDSKGNEVTTASCKLTGDNTDSCVLDSLPIIEVKNGYEAIGWNVDASAHEGVKSQITITRDTKQLYSISKRKAVTYEATWEANGNTLSDNKKTTTCDIPEVYNDEEISIDSCEVQAPVITGTSTTPKILGFSDGAKEHDNILLASGATFVLSEENSGRVWYAQTSNVPKANRVLYQKRGVGVLNLTSNENTKDLDSMEEFCIPDTVYNGAKVKTSCNITLAKPTIKDNYTWLGWNTNQDAHEGTLDQLTVTGDITLYPITLRTSKTLTAIFAKNGHGVSSIDSTSYSCTIPEEYNALSEVNECYVTMPGITTQNDYKALGWSQNENAKESNEEDIDGISQDRYGEEKYIPLEKNRIPLKVKDSREDSYDYHYYSISKLEGIDVQITWDYNGVDRLTNKLGEVVENHSSPFSCHLPDIYNNEAVEQTTCDIEVPSIEREGFHLVGFSTNKDLEKSDDLSDVIIPGKELSVTRNMNGVTLYAITNKTIEINWNPNGAQADSTKSSCTIYNNSDRCKEQITSPNIIREGFTIQGWSRDSDSISSEWDVGVSKRITLDDVRDSNHTILDHIDYYAITNKEVTIQFHKNGAARQWYENQDGSIIEPDSDDSTITKTCIIGNRKTECEIVSPFIEGKESTPHVIGYSLKKDKYDSDWDMNSMKAVTSDAIYYAQTESVDENEYVLTYHQQGNGVSSIGRSSDTCKVPKVYNGAALKNECVIDTLADIHTIDGYQALGWSQNEDATEEDLNGIDGYIPIDGRVILSSNADYYSISKKPKRTYQAIFHKNGAASQSYVDHSGNTIKTEDDSITLECSTKDAFNRDEPDSGCSIMAPSIEASKNTPKVNGYSEYENATVGSIGANTEVIFSSDLADGSRKDYYAITEKEAENIYGMFYLNGAKSYEYNKTVYIGNNTILLCVKPASYNGEEQSDCIANMPKINATEETPKVIGWSTDFDNHTKKYDSNGSDISLGKNVELYAQTYKDEEYRTVADYREGKNVSKVGEKTDENSQCVIPKTYNGELQSDSCTVTPPNITAKKGYTSIGYSTKDDQDNYNNENYDPIVLNSSNNDKVWYANAIGNAYIIEFYSDGKKVAQQEAQVSDDFRLDLSSSENLKNLQKDGYSFKGWDKTESATTVDYEDGMLITDLTPEKGDIIKLYAVWVDDQGPSCEFGTPQSVLHTSETTQMTVTCTDPNQVQRKSLNATDFIVTSMTGNGSVLDVGEPIEVENGFQYTITIQGLSVGEFKVGLNSGSLSDLFGNYNNLEESDPITVNGLQYTATFTKNGLGVEEIGATSKSCTTSGSDLTCSILLPDITVSSGYTALGWSQNDKAEEISDDYITGYIPLLKENNLDRNELELSQENNNKTYYSISKKDAVTYSVNFIPNGSTLSKQTASCTIADAYNSNTQATTCQVELPTITRDGFTIIGFDPENKKIKEAQSTTIPASTQDESGNIIATRLTLSEDSKNDNYYALTYKDVTATFMKNGADSQASDNIPDSDEIEKDCTIFNSDTSCSVVSPTVVRKDFEVLGYHSSEDGRTSEWDVNSSKEISSDITYYAITAKSIGDEIIYYNGDSGIKRASNSCTIWNRATNCKVPIPDEIKVDGPNGISYAGLSKNKNSTTPLDNITESGNEIIVVPGNNIYYVYYQQNQNITYYYYNSGIKTVNQNVVRTATINENGDSYVEDSNDVIVPNEVTSSTDAAGNEIVGVSNKLNTMSHVSFPKTDQLSSDSTYYAVYSQPATIHYSTSATTKSTRKLYKNGYFTSQNSMKNVLAENSNSTNNYSLSSFNTIGATSTSATNDYENTVDKVPTCLSIYNSSHPSALVSSNRLSVEDAALKTETTFYLMYRGTYTGTIYYYNSSATNGIGRIEQTAYKYYTYDFTASVDDLIALPSSISRSGPYGTEYVGLSTEKTSMSSRSTVGITDSPEYYAVYRSSVNWYYYNQGSGSGDMKQIYRNSFITTNGSGYMTVLSDASTGISEISLGNANTGPNGSSPRGLKSSYSDNAFSGDVDSFAKTTYTSAYTYYTLSVNINFYRYSATAYGTDSYTTTRSNAIRAYAYNGDTCTPSSDSLVAAPVGSSGPYGTSLKGYASKTDSMTNKGVTQGGNLYISLNDDVNNYYAIYQSSVTQYYYKSGSSSRTVYRNSYFSSSQSGYNTVLADNSTGLSNFSISGLTGYNGSMGAGLMPTTPTSSNAGDYSSVAYCAKDSTKTYYTIYKKSISVTFYYSNGNGSSWSSSTASGTRLYNYGTTVLKNGSVSLPSGFSASKVPTLSGTSSVSFEGWHYSPDTMGDFKSFTTAHDAYYATYSGSRMISFSAGTGVQKLSTSTISRPIYIVKKAATTGYESQSSYSITSSDLPTITYYDGYGADGWYNDSTKVTFPYSIATGVTLTAKGKDTKAPSIHTYGTDGSTYTNGTSHSFNVLIYMHDNNFRTKFDGTPVFKSMANSMPSVSIGSVGSPSNASVSLVSGPTKQQVGTNEYIYVVTYKITIASSNTATGSVMLTFQPGYAVDEAGNGSTTTTLSSLATVKAGSGYS